MNPVAIPRVKNLVSRSTLKECDAFVRKALRLRTAQEISELLHKLVLNNFPEEFRLFAPDARTPREVDFRKKRELLRSDCKQRIMVSSQLIRM